MEFLMGLGHVILRTADFWMDHLFFINVILSIVIVFFERRDPKTVWTWLLVLYFIPILGIFLYFIIGYDFHKAMFDEPTVVNAVYNASELFLDIINVFIRVLSLLSRRD